MAHQLSCEFAFRLHVLGVSGIYPLAADSVAAGCVTALGSGTAGTLCGYRAGPVIGGDRGELGKLGG